MRTKTEPASKGCCEIYVINIWNALRAVSGSYEVLIKYKLFVLILQLDLILHPRSMGTYLLCALEKSLLNDS